MGDKYTYTELPGNLHQHACPNSPLHFLPSKMRSPAFGATQQENMAANTQKYSCPLFWECSLWRFKIVVSKTVHVIFSCFLVVAKRKHGMKTRWKCFENPKKKWITLITSTPSLIRCRHQSTSELQRSVKNQPFEPILPMEKWSVLGPKIWVKEP